jgi:hypothetical protein
LTQGHSRSADSDDRGFVRDVGTFIEFASRRYDTESVTS